MAELTAGNFYWTGYKPAGQNPLYKYKRGDKSFGTALSHQGGAGGCTGYSWNEVGNWVVQSAGFTNDPDNPGGYIEGFYYEEAIRTPRGDDNVYFSGLSPDDPGIQGHYPASECLFGGILGGTYTDGGSWETGTGFGLPGQIDGNALKIFVEDSYSTHRGASFELGNVFGSTFGQSFLGASADIDIRGLTGLFGLTGRMGFQITNFDGTTANFFGNTFYGFTSGGTGNSAAGFSAEGTVMEAFIAGGFLQNGDYFVGTDAGSTFYGMTHATESLYRSIVTGISNGDVKMQISPFVNGMTSFGLTMNEPGPRGNKNFGDFAQLIPHGMESRSFILNGGLSAGRDGVTAFSGGTDNKVEQPQLSVKTESLTVRGDASVNLNHSRISKQAFVLSKCQFNYNGGIINQMIFDREDIDYLGKPKTAASLLDTEVTNSVVISGGGLQTRTTSGGTYTGDDDPTGDGSTTVNRDVSGARPVTYIRPTNTIPTVEVDAFRHGNVIIEGAATTLNMKPEKTHLGGQSKQGKVFINKPLNDSTRITYSSINLKSFNDAQNIAGTEDNNLLFLNAGLTISNLDIGAGTVAVGNVIGGRPITVVKGEMSSKAVLKARSETNPSYQGFKIGDDLTGTGDNSEGILISHPAANIEFSTGHYVLASFADGNTGADTGFQRPGSATPVPPGFGK